MALALGPQFLLEFNIKYIILISLFHVAMYCDPEKAGVTWCPEIIPAFPLQEANGAKYQDRNEKNLWACERSLAFREESGEKQHLEQRPV